MDPADEPSSLQDVLLKAIKGVREDVKDVKEQVANLKEEFLKRSRHNTKAFSAATSNDAAALLQQLGLAEVNGNEEEQIEKPSDCPVVAEDFDYSRYPDEDTGTPYLLDHHKKQLQKFGVNFGRGYFAVYDIHSDRSMYSFVTKSGLEYRGTADGCISAYGLMKSVAGCGGYCAVLFEHKQSSEAQTAFREREPQWKGEGESAKRPFKYEALKGQAVTSYVGAAASSNFPLMLDLTDGVQHNLLLVRQRELVVWTNLDSTTAYYKQAVHLDEICNRYSALHPSLRCVLEELPDDIQAPLKKIRRLV
mmetsp:Transcript_10663/g.18696  ORF Transcript_10663/g.18696 Transcript_10663/m.18696 type:complete len:306 (+) Transcript_10663:149-1066(+)